MKQNTHIFSQLCKRSGLGSVPEHLVNCNEATRLQGFVEDWLGGRGMDRAHLKLLRFKPARSHRISRVLLRSVDELNE